MSSKLQYSATYSWNGAHVR